MSELGVAFRSRAGQGAHERTILQETLQTSIIISKIKV